jgi:hypothetical protein
MLERRTGLRPGRGLRQVSAKREAGLTKAPRRKATGPTPAVRALVWAREENRCARCGVTLPGECGTGEVHHRRSRGQGGSSHPLINSPANLVLLGSSCHRDITLNANRAAALAEGWVLELNACTDPAAVPVQHALHGWVRLDTAGGWSPAPMRGAA